MQYLISFCSRPEAASDVISDSFVGPVVLDQYVKFRGPSLERSREMPHEAVGSGIFDNFFRYNFPPEEDNEVIASVAVDNVGVNDPAKNLVFLGQTVFEIFEELFPCRTNRTKPIPIGA